MRPIVNTTYVSYTIGQIRRRLFRFTSAKKSIHDNNENYEISNKLLQLQHCCHYVVYGSDCFSCEKSVEVSKIVRQCRRSQVPRTCDVPSHVRQVRWMTKSPAVAREKALQPIQFL